MEENKEIEESQKESAEIIKAKASLREFVTRRALKRSEDKRNIPSSEVQTVTGLSTDTRNETLTSSDQ